MNEKPQQHSVASNARPLVPPMLAAAPPQMPPPVLANAPSPSTPPRLSVNSPSSAPPKIPLQQKRVEPPKEPKPSRGCNSGVKIALIIGGACFLVICALGIGIAWIKRANHQNTAGAFFSRKDTVEDYVSLCETLLDKIKLVGGVEPSEAELAIAARRSGSDIDRISRQAIKLAEIAQSLLEESAKQEQILTNLPNGKAFASGAGEVMTGLNSNSNEQVWSGLMKAAPDIIRGLESYDKIMEFATYHHGVAIKLAKLAPEFSGPPTNGAALICSFAEHQPGVFEFFEPDPVQYLSLSNSFGSDLHSCVIVVRLSDADGKSYVNLHFAPFWPKDGNLSARYRSSEVYTKTLPNATRVEVNVCARELSFEPILLKKPQEGWPEPK